MTRPPSGTDSTADRWAPPHFDTRMNHKDLCFLGLIALAYVYLDARIDESLESSGTDRSAARDAVPPAPGPGTALVLRPLRALVPVEPGCPRSGEHPIIRRADGAFWCRACDEAYYPTTAEALLAIA